MLCDPKDCSPPGSSLWPGFSIHGIFQARVLEWVAISRGSSWSRDMNLGLLHCRQMLYHPSHQKSPNNSQLLCYQPSWIGHQQGSSRSVSPAPIVVDQVRFRNKVNSPVSILFRMEMGRMEMGEFGSRAHTLWPCCRGWGAASEERGWSSPRSGAAVLLRLQIAGPCADSLHTANHHHLESQCLVWCFRTQSPSWRIDRVVLHQELWSEQLGVRPLPMAPYEQVKDKGQRKKG